MRKYLNTILFIFIGLIFIVLLVLPLYYLIRQYTDTKLTNIFGTLFELDEFKVSLQNSALFGTLLMILSPLISYVVAQLFMLVISSELQEKIAKISSSAVKYFLFTTISVSMNVLFLSKTGIFTDMISMKSNLIPILFGIWISMPITSIYLLRIFIITKNKNYELFATTKIGFWFKQKILLSSTKYFLIYSGLISFMLGSNLNLIGLYQSFQGAEIYGKQTMLIMSIKYASIGSYAVSAAIAIINIVLASPIIFLAWFVYKRKVGKELKQKSNLINYRFKTNNIFKTMVFWIMITSFLLPYVASFIQTFIVDNQFDDTVEWTTNNYTNYWSPTLTKGMFNTMLYSFLSALLLFIIYSFTIFNSIYYNSKLLKNILTLMVVSMVIPSSYLSLGVFLVIDAFKMTKSFFPLIFIGLFSPTSYLYLNSIAKNEFETNKYILETNEIGYWFKYRKIFLSKNEIWMYFGWWFIDSFNRFNIPTLITMSGGIPTFGLAVINIVDGNEMPMVNARLAISYVAMTFGGLLILVTTTIGKQLTYSKRRKIWKRF